ncbi:MAG: ATP-dependent RecD-like DNA helicase [Pseudomonadota bacterium]|jgi:exodeoxyribonuclease V alpha subunit
MKEATESEVVRGTIDRVTFRNHDNGYSVLQITLDDENERITAVGICPQVKAGSHVTVTGSFLAHPKFGKQFTVRTISETPPSTSAGIERYLSSGLISGVGKRTAKRIVDEFGVKSLEVIRRDPTRVAALAGIGKKRADLLHSALVQQTEFDETMRFLVEHQISPSLAAKIYQRFQGKTLEVLKSDPYLLAREIRGIGFHTADTIALNLGIAPDSPLRLRAGIYCALLQASDEGHCYLSEQVLLERSKLLLGLEETPDLSEQLHDLLTSHLVVAYNGGIFLKQFDTAERFVAQWVSARSNPYLEIKDKTQNHQEAIADAEQNLGLTLSPEQRYAVELASLFPLMIITGGPGCGKTTMVKALTRLFEKSGMSFALAAPTGKAAQRLSQVCGAPSSTIHRLLKYDPMSKDFVFNARNPLPYDALIVDEASMIDILLAKDLLAAIPDHCRLILVGDKDQLPSVGPGKVFGDLIRSPHVKTIQLSQLFRRNAESRINTVAHMINVGEVPDIPTPDGITKSDAYMVERRDIQESAQTIESLVAEQIPKKFGHSGTDIAVLTPTNRGPLGTLELNKRLQERLNPRSSHSPATMLEIGEISFRVGDRVCQRVNNYKIDPSGVFNGDLGIVTSIDPESNAMTIELWDGRLIKYTRGELSQLALAYAVTVHRSQGMEVPCVVLAIDESHFTLLERQLVYTGVTRAKKLLIVVGSRRALSIATKRTQTRKRCTLLLERINEQVLGLKPASDF